LCLNDCPTYRVLGDEADSPRGRIQLIKSLVTVEGGAAPVGPPSPRLVEHLEACLVCRACETACPSGVPFGRIMEGAREVLRGRERVVPLSRALGKLGLDTLTRPARLVLLVRLAELARRLGIVWLAAKLPGRLGWLASLAPRMEGPAFALADRAGADVSILAGCIMRATFGETDRATVRLLEGEDLTVTAPIEQTCCGALHAHAGDGERARELARLNIDAFAGSAGKVVVNAAGCGAHMKDYGELLADDPAWADRAKRFAARVRDLSEVLKPRPRRTAGAIRVAYQDACHLAHGQRIRTQPRALLQQIEGVTVVDIADPERCCGSAGIYNLTHPDVSGELQREKVAAILAARPDVVVSANPGCILQIAAGLRAAGAPIPVVHLARFLDEPRTASRP
jgi:glycolate oxidase iron-sulfur subunit